MAIGEDVTNNFSSTAKLIKLIRDNDCKPVVIISWLNRSLESTFQGLVVESLDHHTLKQYRQTDDEVVSEVARGNVCWEPKQEFQRLRAIYESNRRQRLGEASVI